MSEFVRQLQHDHHVIQQVVAGMSAVADLLDSGKQVDPGVLADLVQFLRIFAGRCHHTKEEQFLFPLLETKANARANRELNELEGEHRRAAELVEQLAGLAILYPENPVVLRHRVVSVLRSLAELYPTHIWKEDYLLFPLAARELSRSEQERLQQQFDDVELEVGTDVHSAFEMLAKRLETVVEYRNSGACPLCSAAA